MTRVTPNYVRLLVGIEHGDDILPDIQHALKKAAKIRRSKAA